MNELAPNGDRSDSSYQQSSKDVLDAPETQATDQPYRHELDETVRQVLRLHPSGINLNINVLLWATLGNPEVPAGQFQDFKRTLLSHPNIAKKPKGPGKSSTNLYRISASYDPDAVENPGLIDDVIKNWRSSG